MNLPAKTVRQIQRGEKTEHRVLAANHRKPKITSSLVVAHSTNHEDPRRRRDQVRVRVLEVQTATVGDTGTQGAKAEGYPTLTAFASDWMRRHDPHWPPTTEALCPECAGHKHYDNHAGERVECDYCDEVGTIQIEDRERLADTELVIARFQRRHAHHLVHVIRFELDVDIVHYLNKRAYLPPTTNPTEALDPEAPLLGDPEPGWAARAEARRLAALKDRDGARLAGLDRIAADLQAEAQRLALETGIDVDSHVRELGRKVGRLRAKLADQQRRDAA